MGSCRDLGTGCLVASLMDYGASPPSHPRESDGHLSKQQGLVTPSPACACSFEAEVASGGAAAFSLLGLKDSLTSSF